MDAPIGKPLSPNEGASITSLRHDPVKRRLLNDLMDLFYMRHSVNFQTGEPLEPVPNVVPIRRVLRDAQRRGVDPEVLYRAAVRFHEAYPEPHRVPRGVPAYDQVKPA